MSGSDFVEMFVGVGASRVRDLFRQAKENRLCIILSTKLMPLDAHVAKPKYGKQRRTRKHTKSITYRNGRFWSNSGAIILAATNRADILIKPCCVPVVSIVRSMWFCPMYTNVSRFSTYTFVRSKSTETVDVNFLGKKHQVFGSRHTTFAKAALIAARKTNLSSKNKTFDAVDRIVGGLEKRQK